MATIWRAVACRHPETFGRHEAYVAVQFDLGVITSVFFENGMDFVGHPESWNRVREIYSERLAHGWVPIDPEEVKIVAGTIVSQEALDRGVKPNQSLFAPTWCAVL